MSPFRMGATIVFLGVLAFVSHAEEPVPTPGFDRVDHARPAEALAPCTAFAPAETLRAIAEELKRDDPLEVIRAVEGWVRQNLRYDKHAAYRWRTLAQMLEDGTYGGCADHGVVFGQLLRAAGIPVVYVKTMDADWIRDFVRGPEPGTWSGHVFLEVHLDGAWRLLDASAMVLYRDYDPRQRILPGGRWAYDKGLDPYTLVLSVRWEMWKKQTRAFFEDFDLAQLPVAGGTSLRSAGSASGAPAAPGAVVVSVVGAEADAAPLTRRLHEVGQTVDLAYDWKFDVWYPKGKGGWIFVLAPDKVPALPERYLRETWGEEYETFQASLGAHASGVFSRPAPDGTRLYVIWGARGEALERAIAAVPLPGAR